MTSNKHLEQVQALNLAFAATEQKLTAEIAALRQREQQVTGQVQALQQQAEQKQAEQAHALNQQLATGQQELHRLEQERALLEKNHTEQARKDRQEREILLRNQARRELEVAAQLLATQQRAAQDKVEQSHNNGEQERALQRQHATREQALSQHVQAGQEELHRLQQAHVQREQAVAEKLEAIQIRAAQETAELARTLTAQQHTLHSQHLAREQTLGQQLETAKQESTKREHILLEQTSQARQETEDLLRAQAQREHEVLTQLLAAQQQATREKVDLARGHAEKVRELGSQQAQREKALTQQLQAHQQELRNLQTDSVKREREAAQEKVDLIHRQREQERALQRQHADREQAISQQLQAGQDELHRLQQERAQREKEHAGQTGQARQELDNLLRARVQRELEVAAQLLAMQQKAAREKAEQARTDAEKEHVLSKHVKREKTQSQQLLTQQQEFRHLQLEQSKREQALQEEQSRSRQELEVLRRATEQREQEVLAQLLGGQQQAAQEKAELLQKQSAQEQTLHKLHTEREAALTQQLLELRQALQCHQRDSAQLVNTLKAEISTLQNEIQTLRNAQKLQTQEYRRELSSRLDEHTGLLGACATQEAQLQAEIGSRNQANLRLSQMLAEVRHHLELTHTSFGWRVTAPLRKLAGLFTSNENQASTPVNSSEQIMLAIDMHFVSKVPQINVNRVPLEPTMLPTAQATSRDMPAIAKTLTELLACHGHQFVNCAYRTLLGRAPDLEGLDYYLTRLGVGHSKFEIVSQLYLSKEGKTRNIQLPGLQKAIQNHRRSQYPFVGWIFRLIEEAEGNSPTERKLRAIENQLFLLGNENNRRFNQIESTLTDLHRLSLQSSLVLGAKSAQEQVKSTNVYSEPDAAYKENTNSSTHPPHKLESDVHIDKLMQRIWDELKRDHR